MCTQSPACEFIGCGVFSCMKFPLRLLILNTLLSLLIFLVLQVLMIVVEIKGYPNVQLQSHCSSRYVRVEGKKLFANETSMYPRK